MQNKFECIEPNLHLFFLIPFSMLFFVLLLFWHGTDLGGRLRALALVSVWILVNGWLGHLYRYMVEFERYNWVQALVFGTVAGMAALGYVRLVVVPLWRRARRAAPTEAATGP